MMLMQAGSFTAREEVFDAAAWYSLVGATPGFGLVQTWEYGKAKSETGPWRLRHLLIENAGRPVAAAQVMLRELPFLGGGLAWINRGPIFLDGLEARPEFVSGILRALVLHFVKERGFYLRLAPPWAAGAYDMPVMDTGLAPAGRQGWASARLDLSAPIVSLRAGLRKNWRSALSSAEKNGLEVHSQDDDFPQFLDGYHGFLKERGFPTGVTPPLLDALQRHLPQNRKLRAFNAGPKNAPIGGVLISLQGNTAEYLAAFRNADGNRRNAGQLSLWRAICAAREAGLRWFDLGGMDPVSTSPGVLKFKEGVGAQPYRLSEELESSESWRARLVRWKVRRSL